MAKRDDIDWAAIERDWRADQLSVRAIARLRGTAEGTIRGRAKSEGWPDRDLSGAVRKQVRARLTTADAANEDLAVSEAADRGVAIVRDHRKDLSAGRALVGMLFDQLRQAATYRGDIEDAIEELTAGDGNGIRRANMLRAVSLPTHAGTLRDLTTAIKNLIPLERQAFNLDEPPPTPDIAKATDEQLRRIADGEDPRTVLGA